MFVKKIAIGLAVLMLAVFQARAAGMTTHMFMSDVALDKISDPELKALLKSQRDAVMAGTVFPDTGNGLKFSGWPEKYNFGPVAHGQPFLEAYLAYIKENCSQPYSDHCQLLIGHESADELHHVWVIVDDQHDSAFHRNLGRDGENARPAFDVHAAVE